MDQTLIFLTILGMAVATYPVRALPLLALASRDLHPGLRRFLGFVPTAVLSAMLAQGVLLEDGSLSVGPDNIFLLAAVPAFATAILTRSFFGTVAVGMGVVAGCRYFGL
ncbi:AzlD domain-containing protein [Desulfocurvus sp.]|jgi:branched-subunit amino acid transport protein|uniref:AzlD domain-containing protein n=1 Tax=Desulfocurvus sp. TaxID=2871698 RepID=UPI0025B96DB3|nr:AzlD domain-containing protein [Desulfocurvus sp.]MCK9241434.1 AzlD domain-containing protein [Desulfocurvus sp.]